MKPYILVIRNYFKLRLYKWFRCRNMIFSNIELFSRNTQFRLQHNAMVKLGSHVVSDGHSTFVVSNGGQLTIGDSVYFNEGCMVSCKSKIVIGEKCKFGPNVMIFDNNHKFDLENGVNDKHSIAPIVIGKNCWLAANVVVLKGTIIDDNCVIGAGCVVSGHISQGSIVTNTRELKIQKMRS